MEKHRDAKKRIIRYAYLGKKTAKIFTSIKSKKLEFEHLCESIDETHRYTLSRCIMILTAFEREYRNIYGENSGRSPEYIQVKKDIIDLIEKYRRQSHGKQRDYTREFLKTVKNRDNSFSTNVNNALMDCKEIMEYFLKEEYEGNYEKTAQDISIRIGAVRNGIAHSRLDLQLEAIHLADIKLVEKLIYAMRLKKIGIRPKNIQMAIQELFG